MALARLKNWIVEILEPSDLNAEFNNILNNPGSLITPITFNLTFTDATYDIGASGATRPRDFYLSRNAVIGGTLVLTGSGSSTTNWQITGGAGSVVMTSTGFFQGSWPTTASAANANVANGDYVKLVTSLRANKHDIQPITVDDAKRTIAGLTGVLYRSNVDEDQRQWAGMIADDTEKVNSVLVSYDEKGALQSVTYDRVPAYLIPLAQDHESRLAKLEATMK